MRRNIGIIFEMKRIRINPGDKNIIHNDEMLKKSRKKKKIKEDKMKISYSHKKNLLFLVLLILNEKEK